MILIIILSRPLLLSTPDVSVRTRFSRYKGCRAVGTKINKILNCYLPFVAAGAGTNVQILHSAWSGKVRRRIQGRVNISFLCRERYRGALSFWVAQCTLLHSRGEYTDKLSNKNRHSHIFWTYQTLIYSELFNSINLHYYHPPWFANLNKSTTILLNCTELFHPWFAALSSVLQNSSVTWEAVSESRFVCQLNI